MKRLEAVWPDGVITDVYCARDMLIEWQQVYEYQFGASAVIAPDQYDDEVSK